MTLEQYANEIEQAIEDRDMPIHWVVNLRLNLRLARKRGVVDRLDELFLEYAGVPWHGPVVDIRKQPSKRPKSKQIKMF